MKRVELRYVINGENRQSFYLINNKKAAVKAEFLHAKVKEIASNLYEVKTKTQTILVTTQIN